MYIFCIFLHEDDRASLPSSFHTLAFLAADYSLNLAVIDPWNLLLSATKRLGLIMKYGCSGMIPCLENLHFQPNTISLSVTNHNFPDLLKFKSLLLKRISPHHLPRNKTKLCDFSAKFVKWTFKNSMTALA